MWPFRHYLTLTSISGYFLAASHQHQFSQPKPERCDEQEVAELARQIREANEARFASGLGFLYNPLVRGALNYATPGQPTIQQFFSPPPQLQQPQQEKTTAVNMSTTATTVNGANNGSVTKPEAPSDKEKQALLDEESKKGRFGWFDIEKTYLPFIFRYGTEKYTSVRMVERRLLNRYLQVLPPEVNSCTCIRSYYITDAESKLLNEINMKHQDCIYGKEAFTSKDLVVRLKDAKEFQKFLDLCHKKLVLKRSNASDRCGFFRYVKFISHVATTGCPIKNDTFSSGPRQEGVIFWGHRVCNRRDSRHPLRSPPLRSMKLTPILSAEYKALREIRQHVNIQGYSQGV